jgi:DNA helicase II / ATP-dependent DNA helicase PcrA
VPLGTNYQQAAFVSQRVEELHQEGVPYREMAVLYRAHYHSMEIQLELTKRQIPFSITSGLRFFEQAHIKDVAAFLKIALNPHDEVAVARIAKMLPGVGPKTAISLAQQIPKLLGKKRDFSRLRECSLPAKARSLWKQMVHAFEEIVISSDEEIHLLPPSEAIPVIVMAFYEEWMQEEFPNYISRRDDLVTLGNYAAQFSDTAEFLARLALLGDPQQDQPRNQEEDHLVLSSIHNAKGLEWRVLFLIWLSEGMFPTNHALENQASLEEERRLFYVAVTRCQEELYLTYPQMRLPAYDGNGFQRPSRFISELSNALYEEWEIL